jgi:hypothetical protein
MQVSPSVRALYELLEVSVAPLELTAAVKPLLTQLEQESSSNSKVHISLCFSLSFWGFFYMVPMTNKIPC